MEAERLARLGKRKADETPLDAVLHTRPSQRMKTESDPPAPPLRQPETRFQRSDQTADIAQDYHPGHGKRPDECTRPKLPFWQGAVKKTWCLGQPRLGDDIKIEEVLQKDQLELAVISSFQWDPDFLLQKIDLTRTKICLISHSPDPAEQDAIRASLPSSRARFCFPPMNGPGNMHSKLQILKFSGYLRVVVPTGNFVGYDWGETGVMENMVFLIDLPRLEDQETREANLLAPFGEDLCYFLQAQGVEGGLIRSLRKYDFSETKKYGFVHSCAGSHGDENWRRTGYCGLGRSINTMGLGTKDAVEVDIVCSSLGAINYDLLRMIYHACQGDAGMKEYVLRTSKKSASSASAISQGLEALRARVRVYFPSQRTVAGSIGGQNNAGTIFCKKQWWDQTSFPKAVLRDCKSKRLGVLMHNKIIYVRHGRPTDTNPTPARFVYVGSANLSESAWGRLTKDRASGKPKMTCRNWECGVVVPITTPGKGTEDLSGFQGTVPVPMQTPGDPYVALENFGSSRPAGVGGVLLQPWCLG